MAVLELEVLLTHRDWSPGLLLSGPEIGLPFVDRVYREVDPYEVQPGQALTLAGLKPLSPSKSPLTSTSTSS